MDDPTKWRIGLLGTFRIERDGEVVATFYSRKRDRLLAYLAIEPDRPHMREDLAHRLWPNVTRPDGLQRLSGLLYTLSAYLQQFGAPDDLIVRTYHTLLLNPNVGTDIRDFERLAESCLANEPATPSVHRVQCLREAFGAGLLPMTRDVWFSTERARLATLYRQSILRLEGAPANDFATWTHVEPIVPPGWHGDPVTDLRFMSPFTEADRRRQQLADLFLLVEEATAGIWGADRSECIDRLNTRYAEIRDGLQWAIATGEREFAARIAGALWPYWLDQTTRLDEGRLLIERILSLGDIPATASYGHLVHGSGALALRSGDLVLARTRLETAQQLWQQIGNQALFAQAVNSLGEVERQSGRPSEALSLFAQALDILRALHQWDVVGRVLSNAAAAETALGNPARALAYLTERLELGRARGDRAAVARALADLASIMTATEQLPLANQYAQDALDLYDTLDDDRGRALCLRSLGYILHREGRFEECNALYQRSINLFRAAGDMGELAESIFYQAGVRHEQGHVEAAIDLCRRAQDLFTAIGDSLGVAKVKRVLDYLHADPGIRPAGQA